MKSRRVSRLILNIGSGKWGSVAILTFAASSRLDGESSAGFKKALRNVLSGGSRQLVLDLANLVFLDSEGLGALISVYKTVNAFDGELRLARPGVQVRSALKCTALDRIFPIHPDVEHAVSAYAEAPEEEDVEQPGVVWADWPTGGSPS